MADTRTSQNFRKSGAKLKPKTQAQTLEEEYIHNLQQQAYFLELELKLLKDKEREQKNMFPMEGMENNPLSDNILALKSKYKKLQGDLEKNISILSEENKNLAVTYLSLQKTLEKVSSERSFAEKKYLDFVNYSKTELDRLKKLLTNETNTKDDLQKKINEVSREKELGSTWANELKNKFTKQELQINTTQHKIQEIEEYKNKIVEEKNRKIAELQEETGKIDKEIKENKTLAILLQHIDETTKSIHETSAQRDKFANKVRSLEYSKDLVDKNCSQLNSEKRQLTAQLTELKSEMQKDKAYQDTLIAKRLKDLEDKQIKNSIRDLEMAKKEFSFQSDQLKQKSFENVLLIEERNKLDEEFNKENKAMKDLQDEHTRLNEHVKGLASEMQNANYALKQLSERYEMVLKERGKITEENRKIFKENADFRSQIIYLNKRLEMNDQLKHLNIEDLKTLNRTNLQVNDTLEVLMNKWESIQAFQKSQNFS